MVQLIELGQGASASTAVATEEPMQQISEKDYRPSVDSPEPGGVAQNESLVVHSDGPQAGKTVVTGRHGVCGLEASESCVA